MSILITGINGQDGRIICDKYAAIGENVFGVGRNEILYPDGKTDQYKQVSITDPRFFKEFLDYVRPSHIFHLAASHTNSTGMQLHGETAELEMFSVHVGATQIILDWQRENSRMGTKLVVALSSQMFTADKNLTWVNEHTPLNPSSRYGETKAEAFKLIRDYREKYNVYAAGALLFNHSSRFSKPDFVLIQIAKQIVAVLAGGSDRIFLRNFNVDIDISSAENICNALIRMVSLESPEDFVLASQKLVSVEEIIKHAFNHIGIENWQDYIIVDQKMLKSRAATENYGIIDKAKLLLNWEPNTSIFKVIELMVDHDIKEIKKDKNLTLLIS